MTDLKPHNQVVVLAAIAALQASNQCCVIQPTGTGKSYVIDVMIGPKTAILIAPNVGILRQWKRRFDAAGLRNIRYTTYHSMHKYNGANYDIVILDEFHRSGADTWEIKVLRIKKQVLDAGGQFFGVTATPEHGTSGCMIDKIFDGIKAYEITLQQAFVDKILIPPLYVAAHYQTDRMLAQLEAVVDKMGNISSKRRKTLIQELERAKGRSNDMGGIAKIIGEHLPARPKGILFAIDCEHANKIATQAHAWFPGKNIRVSVIHSKIKDRYEIIDQFSATECEDGEVVLIVAVGMLNEGIHAEGINFCIFMRPTKSDIVYHQQLGRVLSADHKDRVVVFDFVNNVKTLCEVKLISKEAAAQTLPEDEKEEVDANGEKRPRTIDDTDYGIQIVGTDPAFYELLEEIARAKGYVKPPPMIPLKDALEWCRFKQLYSQEDLQRCKGKGSRRPPNFPKVPTTVWRDFWTLVTANLLTAKEVTGWCICNNLFSQHEYTGYLKHHPEALLIVPRFPESHYKGKFTWSRVTSQMFDRRRSASWMKRRGLLSYEAYVLYAQTNECGTCHLVPKSCLDDMEFWKTVAS